MPILRVRLNKLSSDWQVARALLEDEFKSLDKASKKFRTRYEFAAHLLDVHRMWCVRRALAWPSRCLAVRSDGDAADAARSKIYVSASTQTGIKQEDHDDESNHLEKDKDEEQREEGAVDGWIDDGRHSSLQDQIPDTHLHSADVQSRLERTNPDSDLLIKHEVASQELCYVDIESSRSGSTSEQRHDEEIPTPHRGSDVQSNFESTNPISDLLIKQEVVCHENCDVDIESSRNESTYWQRHEEGIPTQHISSDGHSNDEPSSSCSTLHYDERSPEGSSQDLCDADVKMIAHSNNEASSSTLHYAERSPEGSSQDLSHADGKTILENISKLSRSTYDSDECSSEGLSADLCDAGISSNKNVQNQSRSERKTSFQCKSCSKTYFCLSVFHLHLKTHAEPQLHSQRTHTREKPSQCLVCEKDFITKDRLAVHMRTHSGQKLYQCSVCNKAFTSSGHVSRHMRTHTGEKPFECNRCSYRCSKKSKLTVHMRTHTGEKPFQCSVCNKRLTTSAHLSVHMRTHTGKKPFECNYCSFRCSNKSNFTIHIRTHTGEKPFKCNCCSYRCSNKSNLTHHMRTHTGEKPFACNCCSYRCSEKSSLTLHMRTHTGEKPFKCNYCSFRCSDKSNLTNHMRTHTGEKPFECNYCSFRCSLKCSLKRHLRTHTGEKPFECNYCSFRCSQKSNLNIHMRTHTGKRPY